MSAEIIDFQNASARQRAFPGQHIQGLGLRIEDVYELALVTARDIAAQGQRGRRVVQGLCRQYGVKALDEVPVRRARALLDECTAAEYQLWRT